jgi:hypothetical protein
MMTSLNNIRDIEQFLQGEMSLEDSLVFKAKMIVNPGLKFQVTLQNKLHKLIISYGRKQIKNEIQSAEAKVFTSDEHLSFQTNITGIFLNK